MRSINHMKSINQLRDNDSLVTRERDVYRVKVEHVTYFCDVFCLVTSNIAFYLYLGSARADYVQGVYLRAHT